MALSFRGYRIALDSRDSDANVSFVSHAHSDHTGGISKNKKLIASTITKELIEARYGLHTELSQLPEGIGLLNAGHVLGSKQLYVDDREHGYSLLYSGDYQMVESAAAERIELRQADVLILDSTYPYPWLRFCEREETVRAIQHYAEMKMGKGHVVFGAYAVGKAQEIIKILNEAGITPAVDAKVASVSDVYNRHGLRLEYSVAENLGKEPVLVVESSKLGEFKDTIASQSAKRVFTAVASGWAKMFRFGTDVQFPLSDHADFQQALAYINACDPEVVLTCGNSATFFAKKLAVLGYDARPLAKLSQFSQSSLLACSLESR